MSAESVRASNFSRKTGETDVRLSLKLDGKGVYSIDTGVGFFDHMLALFAKHGLFDIDLSASGDLHVDNHHTVEDVGIVMGKAFSEALGDKAGIKRYATAFVPMDETLVMACVDISGRPFVSCDLSFDSPRIGEFDTELVEEFMRAFAVNGGITLHIKLISGGNSHHVAEAAFKALSRALSEAAALDPRVEGVPSTKGSL